MKNENQDKKFYEVKSLQTRKLVPRIEIMPEFIETSNISSIPMSYVVIKICTSLINREDTHLSLVNEIILQKYIEI